MNTNLSSYKERVKLLRKAVSTVLNVECSQSQAYEIIAKEENYPNWDTLSGIIKNNTVEPIVPTLSKKEQLIQLVLLNEALRNGCPLIETINKFLRKQTNPVLREGWSKTYIPEDNNYAMIFRQTGFFNEEVITLIEIGNWGVGLVSGVQSGIEFLKLDII